MGERWIGVTGFYTTDNPHPGLAVVRSLRLAEQIGDLLHLFVHLLARAAMHHGEQIVAPER